MRERMTSIILDDDSDDQGSTRPAAMATNGDAVPTKAYRRPRERKNATRAESPTSSSRATRITIAMQTMPPTEMDSVITSRATRGAFDDNFLPLPKPRDKIILV